MHKLLRIILFPLIAVLPLAFGLVNCARETSPTGGVNDSIPPQIIGVKPLNSSVQIKPQRITIEFDERITLDKVQDNLMISPPLEKKPSIVAKKKKVYIDLSDQNLLDNTTYTFNFTNAIKDINEGNVLEQYSYAFSTGAAIDTLKLSGNITTALGAELPKKVFVVLYSNLTDTAFKTTEPRYVTAVKKNGSFIFNNIAAGTYNIYAIADENNDFTFNLDSEKIGFYTETVSPSYEAKQDTIRLPSVFALQDTLNGKKVEIDSFYIKQRGVFLPHDISIELFSNKQTSQYVRSRERLNAFVYSIGFAQPINENNLKIEIVDFAESAYSVEVLPTKDSVLVWLQDYSLMTSNEVPLVLTYKKNDALRSDTIMLNSVDGLMPRLQVDIADFPTQLFTEDSIVVSFTRPLAAKPELALFSTRDTLALFNSKGEAYVIKDEFAVVNAQTYPKYGMYSPANFYPHQKLVSKKLGQQRFALYFAKEISLNDVTIKLKAQPNTMFYEAEFDLQTNSILCWITDNEVMRYKNPILEISYISRGVEKTETVSFSNIFDEKDMYRNARVARLVAAIHPKQEASLFLDNTLEVIWNNPITEFNDSLFTLIDVTDSLKQNVIKKVEQNVHSARRTEIYHSCRANKSYQLVIERGAVKDRFGNWNKRLVFNINTQKVQKEKVYTKVESSSSLLSPRTVLVDADLQPFTNYALKVESNEISDVFTDNVKKEELVFVCPNPDKFGGLELELDSVTTPMVFELRLQTLKKTQEGVIRTISANGKISFGNIAPGKYDLLYVYDDNANGVWDTGHLETKTLPEQKGKYPKSITIKPSWENKVLWAVPEK